MRRKRSVATPPREWWEHSQRCRAPNRTPQPPCCARCPTLHDAGSRGSASGHERGAAPAAPAPPPRPAPGPPATRASRPPRRNPRRSPARAPPPARRRPGPPRRLRRRAMRLHARAALRRAVQIRRVNRHVVGASHCGGSCRKKGSACPPQPHCSDPAACLAPPAHAPPPPTPPTPHTITWIRWEACPHRPRRRRRPPRTRRPRPAGSCATTAAARRDTRRRPQSRAARARGSAPPRAPGRPPARARSTPRNGSLKVRNPVLPDTAGGATPLTAWERPSPQSARRTRPPQSAALVPKRVRIP